MGVLNLISLLAVYSEITVLAVFEYKIWKTIYTPLNMLMLPYAFVLLLTVVSAGHIGLVDFYYPSIMLWMIGLLIFAIPSYVIGLNFQSKNIVDNNSSFCIDEGFSMRGLNILTTLLVLMFIMRLSILLRTSEFMIGSEDFGEEFCGRGLWGHLHRLLHALAVIYIYKYDKKHWYYAVFVVLIFVISFLYGVKSWVLIPLLGGISMRLFFGKLKLRLSLLIKILISGFLVFLITYFLILYVARGESAADVSVIFEFIVGNFIHYFVSGVLSWSQDLELGILEQPNFDMLISNLLNLFSAATGGEYITPINPHFIHNGISSSNVRTFFGTIYINSTTFQFVATVIVVSALHYLTLIWLKCSRNFFVAVLYFFWIGMLMFGWFEVFFFHLAFLEVPVWILITYIFVKFTAGESKARTTR